MIFATLATQVLARTTNMLNGLEKIKMTRKVYVKAILPIGVLFSISLAFSNYAYLYLSVSFIQMIKVCIN